MEKIKTLATMTDFVEHVYSQNCLDDSEMVGLIINYARLLKQPLTLSMFIAVDANENPTEDISNEGSFAAAYYNEAKSKVIFEGFEISESYDRNKVLKKQGSTQVYSYIDEYENFTFNHPRSAKIIEDLIVANNTMNHILTDSALKQIYGII